jgi:signal transduction histidine kinase/CheY-like chemotaxis protein
LAKLPILIENINSLGILDLENSLTNRLFMKDRGLTNTICTQSAVFLENARLQAQSQAYAQQLEQSLLDLQSSKAALLEVNEELIYSNRLKDRFLANMNHELRTPLNAILGMTQGLKEGAFGAIEPRQLTALKTIERNGTNLLALIDNVFELAKIEAGQLELHYQPTAIAPVCQFSLKSIEQQASNKQIQIDLQIQPNLPDLIVDERCIRQVLINLLDNAVKFTPAGGQIGLKVAECQDLPARVRITVTDTGIGISPANLPQLFQPFIQIDGGLNRQFEGIGLGLALVKRIVGLHGGQVAASSELGQGSSFSIDLPCAKPPKILTEIAIQPLAQIPSTPEPMPTRSPLILFLVKDRAANIDSMSSYLQAKGYQIVVAQQDETPIERTIVLMPAAILIDLQLPIRAGLTAIKLIREFSDVPIIALNDLDPTADAPDEPISARGKCLDAGANEYFAKPVKLKQLTSAIEQLLK